jgi:hypothetical protein
MLRLETQHDRSIPSWLCCEKSINPAYSISKIRIYLYFSMHCRQVPGLVPVSGYCVHAAAECAAWICEDWA